MGFITTISRFSGKEVYCCEADKPGCTQYPAKAHKCPHGYCQRYYFCNNCWKIIKDTWKQQHDNCKTRSIDYNKQKQDENMILEGGGYLRIAALSHQAGGREIVKVIFRNKDGKELGAFMAHETYDSIKLDVPAVPFMYEAHGNVDYTDNTDIYQNI